MYNDAMSQYNYNEEQVANKTVKGQQKCNLKQNFYSRVNSTSKETRVDIKAAEKNEEVSME